MNRHICIILFIIVGSSCNQVQSNGKKLTPDTFQVNAKQKPITLPAAIVNKEKILDSLAQSMIASANSYAETGSVVKEEEFISQFVKVLGAANTFSYNFPSLTKYNITLKVSADKQLKIYSWQSPYSGSMWHIQNILQYMSIDKQTIAASFNNLYEQKDDGTGPSPVLDRIYKIDNSSAVQYLLIGYGQMSGTEPYSVAHLLNITNHKFNINKRLFNINKKLDNEIYISVNVGENQDINTLRKKMAISYDVTNRYITYPLTKEIDNEIVLSGETRKLEFKNGVFK